MGNLTCKHEFSYHLSNDDSQNLSLIHNNLLLSFLKPQPVPQTILCSCLLASQAEKRAFTALFSPPPALSLFFSNQASHEGRPAAFSSNINHSSGVRTHTLWLQIFYIALLLFHYIKVLVFVSKFFHGFILLSAEIISLLTSAGDTGMHCHMLNFQTSAFHCFLGYSLTLRSFLEIRKRDFFVVVV